MLVSFQESSSWCVLYVILWHSFVWVRVDFWSGDGGSRVRVVWALFVIITIAMLVISPSSPPSHATTVPPSMLKPRILVIVDWLLVSRFWSILTACSALCWRRLCEADIIPHPFGTWSMTIWDLIEKTRWDSLSSSPKIAIGNLLGLTNSAKQHQL